MANGVTPDVQLLAGRYQVGERIGRGGMADVHVGVDARLGRRVAIKLLKPALAADPAFRSRFRREAQDAAKMANPTIVRIFDAGEETITDKNGVEVQVPFIIMEFVDGRLLSDLIAAGPIDPHQAVGIIGQVLTALEYSHRAGLIHRDIKPGNIMITSTGQIKVMDFGIARAISETSATISETSNIVGTAQYFSPEQARGESVDARTDIYSTGIVLFEMLTGRAPFVGDNPVAVAYQHVNQQAVRPSAINAQVSPALDAVVLRAMAKDRYDRFQTAADFRAEAIAADSGTTIIKRPSAVPNFNATLLGVNPTATAGSEANLRQLTVDDKTRGSRVNQSRPPVAWIWGGVAVLAVVVVAVLYWTINFTATPFVSSTAIKVPDISGETWDVGSAELSDLDLVPTQLLQADGSVEAGTIISTSPASGINVAPQDEIKVYVSSGGEHKAIPPVIGQKESAATKDLEKAGFTVNETSTVAHSPTAKKGVVIGSTPAEGQDTPLSAVVTLIVSDGKIDVPNVLKQPIADAVSLLRGSTYRLEVTQVPDMTCTGGLVSEQSKRDTQKQHAEITLTFCAGSEPVEPIVPTTPTPAPTP